MSRKYGPVNLMNTITKPTKVAYMYFSETRQFKVKSISNYPVHIWNLADSKASLKCLDDIFNMHGKIFTLVFLWPVS